MVKFSFGGMDLGEIDGGNWITGGRQKCPHGFFV
jgi:hypothetical protein